ncbi:MAG: alkaline phosphatase family protein [Chloroflexi bacterium]|nr:alkaline phosphatase family protein [Chloroflexota bacterium]MCL5108679.1 alkaline phosphatase family protein [Chloroflexota bacterium]
MPGRPTKVMIIGIDSPIASRMYQYAREGVMPTLARVIESGVRARNYLVAFPTNTPPNWTTIATGAWPMTHGITDVDGHLPGNRLDHTEFNVKAEHVQAEQVWRTLERVGKRTIIVNYPTTWGVEPEGGCRIGGCGLVINDWRVDLPHTASAYGNLTMEMLFSTETYPFADQVVFRRAQGWQGVDHAPDALEAEVSPRLTQTRCQVEPFVWHILVERSDQSSAGYDTVAIAKDKSQRGIFARLRVGQWSETIKDTFSTDMGPQRAAFRFKLLELSPDAQRFRLYNPGLCSLSGWAYPPGLEEELDAGGLPTSRAAWVTYTYDWLDLDTVAETAALHNQYQADASAYLLKNRPWDLFLTHIHPPDWLYHMFAEQLDPVHAPDPSQVPVFEKLERTICEQTDRVIARMLEAADEETLVFIISDHGAKPLGVPFNYHQVNATLARAGLLTYVDPESAEVEFAMHGYGASPAIDWSRTKAFAQRFVHIYVNAKGREPNGIVDPGEEYEDVRRRIINALYDYTDPSTGRKPVALALRREDGVLIGLSGPRAGDVVYAIDPYFAREHGEFLPTAGYGIGSMRGLLAMTGPGLRRGVDVDRIVRPVDIIATACHLTGWPVPLNCEGAILYQALARAEG